MTDSKILIVDDDPGIIDTYSSWLSKEYDVETASTGEEALEKVGSSTSTVLLDRRMPGMSGKEVLEKIRDRGYGCRVAIVTGMKPDFDVIEMGFDAYLVKPVTKEDLFDVVERLNERKRYTEKMVEYHSLAAKKAVLEQEKSDEELAASDEYRSLVNEFKEVKENVDSMSKSMSSEGFEAVVRDI